MVRESMEFIFIIDREAQDGKNALLLLDIVSKNS